MTVPRRPRSGRATRRSWTCCERRTASITERVTSTSTGSFVGIDAQATACAPLAGVLVASGESKLGVKCFVTVHSELRRFGFHFELHRFSLLIESGPPTLLSTDRGDDRSCDGDDLSWLARSRARVTSEILDGNTKLGSKGTPLYQRLNLDRDFLRACRTFNEGESYLLWDG